MISFRRYPTMLTPPIRAKRGTLARFSEVNKIHDACAELGFFRGSKKESAICDIIVQYLMEKLPKGGYGILIGTPTPYCVSKSNPKNRTIIDDNLYVGHMMVYSCSRLTIVVGNAVDAKKAQAKVDSWKRHSSMHKARISKQPVNAKSYGRIIRRYAKSGILCKVVFLASGVWKGSAPSQRKYGFDVNFETPSKRLVAQYPNLHILAMTMEKHIQFGIRHLHKDEDTLIGLV
jgi:hypothetical protein